MMIRAETDTDSYTIAALVRTVFGGEYEVGLIDGLRSARVIIVSLVAVEEGAIVGHILFSEMSVKVDSRKVKAAALAPMAVRLDRQRRGIGTKLLRQGCRTSAIAAMRRSSSSGTRITTRVSAFQPR